MMKRIVLASAIIASILFASGVCLAAGSKDQQRPNIILFLQDDFGYGDLHCYGHPYAKTPNIDKLASEGARFTQHYASGVTCCPSRTGIMTGLNTARFEAYPAYNGYADHVTITEILNKHGYTTGHFGKWHMGPGSTKKPGTYGIEFVGGEKDDNAPGRDDGLVRDAIAFIKEHADGPFYLNIWGHSTHNAVRNYPELAAEMGDFDFNREDFCATSDIQKKFDDSQALDPDLKDSMRQYLADVYGVDKNMGRVMAVLDELGIADNTILVFSSDQGPDAVALEGKTREFAHHLLGYAGDLTGGKHTYWEGGTRIPFIIRWPGHVPAGRVENSVTSFLDWLPTLCSIVGIKDIPKGLDGEDVSDIWFNGPRKRNSTLFWWGFGNRPDATIALRKDDWKCFLGPDEPLLFDLSKDASEQHNLARQFPEVVESLSKEAKAWGATLPREYITQRKQKRNELGE